MDDLWTGEGYDPVDLRVDPKPSRDQKSHNGGLHGTQREALITMIQRKIVPATAVHVAWSSGSLDWNDTFRASDLRRFCEIAYATTASRTTEKLTQFLDGLKLSAQRKITFLQATARCLGDDWVGDRRSFLDVTVAMTRLQTLLRQLCQNDRQAPAPATSRSVLLACPPGEQHVFGLQIVEALFRSAGWRTTYSEPKTLGEFKSAVGNASNDVICLSWSSGFLANRVSDCLKAIIRLHQAPMVLAGGYAAERNRNWLAKQGVDHVCASPASALQWANEACRSAMPFDTAELSRFTQHSYGGAGAVPQAV